MDVGAEIQMIGINGHFPRSDEVLEAVSAMLNDAGFNTRVRILETALYRQYRDKPRLEEGPVILQANHDNTTGDAAATLGRHLCSSNRNPVCDEALDAKINAAMAAEGEERENLFREAARYMHEEVMADLLDDPPGRLRAHVARARVRHRRPQRRQLLPRGDDRHPVTGRPAPSRLAARGSIRPIRPPPPKRAPARCKPTSSPGSCRASSRSWGS